MSRSFTLPVDYRHQTPREALKEALDSLDEELRATLPSDPLVLQPLALGARTHLPEGLLIVPVAADTDDDTEEVLMNVPREAVKAHDVLSWLSDNSPEGTVKVESYELAEQYPIRERELLASRSYQVVLRERVIFTSESFEEARAIAREQLESAPEAASKLAVRLVDGDPVTGNLLTFEPAYPEFVPVRVRLLVRRVLSPRIERWLVVGP